MLSLVKLPLSRSDVKPALYKKLFLCVAARFIAPVLLIKLLYKRDDESY